MRSRNKASPGKPGHWSGLFPQKQKLGTRKVLKTGRYKMTSPSTTGAQRLGAQYSLLIVWLCLMIVLLGATSASAQTPINPTTNTILFSGQSAQDPQNHNTDP